MWQPTDNKPVKYDIIDVSGLVKLGFVKSLGLVKLWSYRSVSISLSLYCQPKALCRKLQIRKEFIWGPKDCNSGDTDSGKT